MIHTQNTLRVIDDSFPEGKRVALRVDFNVPMDEKGHVLDTTRITNHLPTLRFLLKKKSHVILLAHLGKPEGKIVPELSFSGILHDIRMLLLADNIVFQELDHYQVSDKITLLENLRFDSGEEANNDDYSKKLAAVADIYVNDAFSVSHRAHASIVGITKYLPCYAGFALNNEFSHLSTIMRTPQHPITLIVGGKKISDKIGVLKHLGAEVEHVLVGGACANTFYQAQGKNIKNSYSETSMIEMCKNLLITYTDKIILPVDFVEADNQYLDIGKQTIQLFSDIISKSKTVIWAGPMGKYEDSCFAKGSYGVLQAVSQNGIVSVIGGGDTIAALQSEAEFEKISFVSLGGGAMLEFLEKETLPGLEPLYIN